MERRSANENANVADRSGSKSRSGARRSASAWVLNLDADLELASSASNYAPTRQVLEAMKPHVERLAASLLAPGDVLVDETTRPGALEGFVGRAFCPTTRAIHLLERAGATPVHHPTQDVLREVNGRAFCASLGQTLPGAVLARDLETAMSVLACAPDPAIARQWRMKRLFGMSGRGQRVIAPLSGSSRGAASSITDADRAFLRASILEGGGVQIEPDVAIVRELGLHGILEEDGQMRLGQLVEQRCDAHGQWLSTEIASAVELKEETREAITNETRRVGEALFGARYFGPFGVDAFLYARAASVSAQEPPSDDRSEMRLQPRSEINARYSMGFAVGFAKTTWIGDGSGA